MKKIKFIWNFINSSFWFVPLIIMALSICLAISAVYADKYFNITPSEGMSYFLPSGPSSARGILSTIATSMIGVAGTVFSITLVALTLASSQFGSRLLRNFMHDRLNQIVLGSYVSTFVYCLIVQNSVSEIDDFTFVPVISVFLAILISIGNIFLLIIFIHHISISIQSDQVVANVSDNLTKSLQVIFPERIGNRPVEQHRVILKEVEELYKLSVSLNSLKSGYLQSIDERAILKLMSEHKLLFKLNLKPGEYIIKDAELGILLSNHSLDEKLINELQATFILDKKRSPFQDPEYAIHQLVEIASRALSPGINDPYTALTCIDNLSSSLGFLANANFPSKYRYDSENKLRVVARKLNFSGMINAAYNQIRQYGSSTPSVMIRLLEALQRISKVTTDQKVLDELKRHADLILSDAQTNFINKVDLLDLEERYYKMYQ